MSIATTTDANGRLITATSGGSVDTSALVVLDPATSTRNVIRPTAAVAPFTIRGDAGNAGSPLWDVQRGSDGFSVANVSASTLALSGYVITPISGSVVPPNGTALNLFTVGYALDVNLNNSRVVVKAAGAANARLVVTGDVGQTAPLIRAQTSAPATLFDVRADGSLELPTAGTGILLKSPDGSTTKLITINNAGVLTLI